MKKILSTFLITCIFAVVCCISVPAAISTETADLKNQTEHESHVLPEYLLVTFLNKNNIDLTFHGNVTYYNSSGEMISSDEGYVWDAPANGNCVMYLDMPKDENYNVVPFDHYSFDYTVEDASKNFNHVNYSKGIAIESNISSNGGVVAKLVNNTGKKIDEVETVIVYYMGDKAVGFSVEMIWGIESEISKEYTSPKDSKYNPIEFDSYRIFVNSTVIYS